MKPNYFERAQGHKRHADQLVAEKHRVTEALKPFAKAYLEAADLIADSDLDDEQPRTLSVTLGDCRRAVRLFPPKF